MNGYSSHFRPCCNYQGIFMKAKLFAALLALIPVSAYSDPVLQVGAFNWDGGDTKAFSYFKITPNGSLYGVKADFVIETEGDTIYKCLVKFDETNILTDSKGYGGFREEPCNLYLKDINRIGNITNFYFQFDQLTVTTMILIYRDADEADKVTLRVSDNVRTIGKVVDTGMMYMWRMSDEK